MARKTAAEVIAEAQADPDWVAARANEDKLREAKAAAWAAEEAALVQELNKLGANITSVWDLVNTRRPYPELVPILLAHVTKPYSDRVLEGLARALGVRESHIGWRTLVDLFVANPDPTAFGSKWGLSIAISAAANASTLDELIELIRDPRHGDNRLGLVDALFHIDDPRAVQLLEELESDPFFRTMLRTRKKLAYRRRKR